MYAVIKGRIPPAFLVVGNPSTVFIKDFITRLKNSSGFLKHSFAPTLRSLRETVMHFQECRISLECHSQRKRKGRKVHAKSRKEGV